MTPSIDVRLYALTDYLDDGLIDRVRAALSGGITALQLRLKGATAREQVEVARALLPLCHNAHVPLLINDRLDIALAVGADGAHLGPDDLPMKDARSLVPPNFILGGSAGSVERARTLWSEGADYLGVGAIYNAHPSKPNASPPRGVDVLRAVRSAVPIPIVAIGGISLETAPACVRAGAHGVAVIRAVFAGPNPAHIQNQARALRDAVDHASPSTRTAV